VAQSFALEEWPAYEFFAQPGKFGKVVLQVEE